MSKLLLKIVNTILPTEKVSTSSKFKQCSILTQRSYFQVPGPDLVLPSQNPWTTLREGHVKIDMGASGTTSLQPVSVPGMLHRTASVFPDRPALATKNSDGSWKMITYKEYEQMVQTCAKAFIKLGLKRYHSVCILGFNAPEWFISNFAAIYAGGFAAGIYSTNNPEACYASAEMSGANIFVVEDKIQLDKVMSFKHRLPELKAIVQYTGKPDVPGVLSWEELLKIGAELPNTELENVLKTIGCNQCCSLLFTSGTVGQPKAVMLSHDNLTWTALNTGLFIGVNNFSNPRIVSYLPLSHIAAQWLDLYITCMFGGTVYFADKDVFKGSLLRTLKEVRPIVMLAVPRIWEKMLEGMLKAESRVGRLKRSVSSWARSVGLQHNLNVMNGVPVNKRQYDLANRLVFQHVKQSLGLDECKFLLSGSAPISLATKKFFWSFDMLVVEAYGLSETTGGHTVNTSDAFRLTSIGKSIPGVSSRILDLNETQQMWMKRISPTAITKVGIGNLQTQKSDPAKEGEILLKGRNIFMGYLNDPVKTKEVMGDDRWFHSGDVGTIDEHGFLYITGRTKEILITAGGKNIAPAAIEAAIIEELPCISHAVVIGDGRKYLTVLLTFKTKVNPETGTPTDVLTTAAQNWCRQIGCNAKTVTEIFAEPNKKMVIDAIQKGIDRTNEKAFSRAHRIQKFAILPNDFSMASDEIGPTMKKKRGVIAKKYTQIIEDFYKEKP